MCPRVEPSGLHMLRLRKPRGLQDSVKFQWRYRMVEAIPKIRAGALQIQHLRDPEYCTRTLQDSRSTKLRILPAVAVHAEIKPAAEKTSDPGECTLHRNTRFHRQAKPDVTQKLL